MDDTLKGVVRQSAQAFACGHRHRVGGHREDDQDDDEADTRNHLDDRVDHRDERQLKRLLGLGECGGERIGELRIDRARDVGHLGRIVDVDHEYAGVVGRAWKALLEKLVQKVIVKIELARDGRLVTTAPVVPDADENGVTISPTFALLVSTMPVNGARISVWSKFTLAARRFASATAICARKDSIAARHLLARASAVSDHRVSHSCIGDSRCVEAKKNRWPSPSTGQFLP